MKRMMVLRKTVLTDEEMDSAVAEFGIEEFYYPSTDVKNYIQSTHVTPEKVEEVLHCVECTGDIDNLFVLVDLNVDWSINIIPTLKEKGYWVGHSIYGIATIPITHEDETDEKEIEVHAGFKEYVII